MARGTCASHDSSWLRWYVETGHSISRGWLVVRIRSIPVSQDVLPTVLCMDLQGNVGKNTMQSSSKIDVQMVDVCSFIAGF